MNHVLIYPLWEDVDAKRTKSALSGDLTPLSIDAVSGNASFAGSSEKYWVTLEECTCRDFHINQARSSPCKHMIRLAMELKLIPSDGKVDDIKAAQYKVALPEITAIIKHGDLLTVVDIARTLNDSLIDGKYKPAETEDFENSKLSLFYEPVTDGETTKLFEISEKRRTFTNQYG